MRYFICLFGLFFLLGLSLNAQVFRSGRLVTNKGDTLTGLVANGAAETIAFKKSKNAAQQVFQRKEIVGYNFDGYNYEEHIFEVLRAKFPERIKEYLKVLMDGGQVRLLQYEGKGLFNSDHVGYYLHEEGMDVPLRVNEDPRNFKTQMSQYFGDYPDLAKKIKNKELTYDQIPVIVAMFNDWYSQLPIPEPVAEKPKKQKKAKKEKPSKEDSKASEEGEN